MYNFELINHQLTCVNTQHCNNKYATSHVAFD